MLKYCKEKCVHGFALGKDNTNSVEFLCNYLDAVNL